MSRFRSALEIANPAMRAQAQRKYDEAMRRRKAVVIPLPGLTLAEALERMAKHPKRRPVSSTRIMIQHLEANGITGFQREVKFHPTRKWRFDFGRLDVKLAIEIEGVTFEGGRHQRLAGFSADLEKYAEALILGWRVLRVTPGMVCKGIAINWIRRALA